MSDFINTIDALGDDAVMDSLIDGSITEFKDDMLTFIGSGAFRGCSNLTTLDLPKVTRIYASALDGVSITKICLPSFISADIESFRGTGSIRIFDLPVCTSLSADPLFNYSGSTKRHVILRNNAICSIGNHGSSIAYAYVPRDLIEDYKVATHWSTITDKLRAIEDWTVDGTVTGAIRERNESYALDATELTFTDSNTRTLTPTGALGILDIEESIWKSSDNTVALVVDGVVTPFGDGTATITVTSGEFTATCAVTVNAGLEKKAVVLMPLDGAKEGELPRWKLYVTAGQTLEITYYLTRNKGYLYDGRQCGLSYINNNNVVNAETTITLTIPSDGYITFSDYNGNNYANGELGYPHDRLYGKYLYVTVS